MRWHFSNLPSCNPVCEEEKEEEEDTEILEKGERTLQGSDIWLRLQWDYEDWAV